MDGNERNVVANPETPVYGFANVDGESRRSRAVGRSLTSDQETRAYIRHDDHAAPGAGYARLARAHTHWVSLALETLSKQGKKMTRTRMAWRRWFLSPFSNASKPGRGGGYGGARLVGVGEGVLSKDVGEHGMQPSAGCHVHHGLLVLPRSDLRYA